VEERRNRESDLQEVLAVRTWEAVAEAEAQTFLARSMGPCRAQNHVRPQVMWSVVPCARRQAVIQRWSTIHTVSCDMMVSVGESHDSVDLDRLCWLDKGGVGGRYSCRV